LLGACEQDAKNVLSDKSPATDRTVRLLQRELLNSPERVPGKLEFQEFQESPGTAEAVETAVNNVSFTGA